MIEGIQEVARFAGWDVDLEEEALLLGRMEVVLAALVEELRHVRHLDVAGLAPSGLGGVRRDAPRF